MTFLPNLLPLKIFHLSDSYVNSVDSDRSSANKSPLYEHEIEKKQHEKFEVRSVCQLVLTYKKHLKYNAVLAIIRVYNLSYCDFCPFDY
jgi:hypothetical protein